MFSGRSVAGGPLLEDLDSQILGQLRIIGAVLNNVVELLKPREADVSEFSAVIVHLASGPVDTWMPGPEHPGVAMFTMTTDGPWLIIHAIPPANGSLPGYIARRYSAAAVLFADTVR